MRVKVVGGSVCLEREREIVYREREIERKREMESVCREREGVCFEIEIETGSVRGERKRGRD